MDSKKTKNIHNWKATEFHQFLAYTGIIALYGNVHEDIYYTFTLLHCAYRLLCGPHQIVSNINQANELLELFVGNFPIVFGENSVSFNVHSLLHIAACAEEYGPLTSFSAYEFKNKLQILKKHVRKPTGILQQIVNKEKHEILTKIVKNDFAYVRGEIVGTFINDCYFSTKSLNNFCSIRTHIPVKN